MPIKTPIPLAQIAFLTPSGRVNEPWRRYLLSLGDDNGEGGSVDLGKLLVALAELRQQDAATVPVMTSPRNEESALHSPVPVSPRQSPEEPGVVFTHGVHDDGTLHALASADNAGFMSADDKAKLDTLTSPSDSANWAMVAKASLPTPSATNKGWRRFVTDATGASGIIPAYSDGTAWKRFSDDSAVN